MRRGHAGEAGFTLLEVLVALAVFALAALALLRLQAMSVRTAADLDGNVLARAVVRNLMVEIATDPAPPPLGAGSGEAVNAGRKWRWTRQVTPLPDPRLVLVELRARPAGGTASPVTLRFARAAR